MKKFYNLESKLVDTLVVLVEVFEIKKKKKKVEDIY